MNQEKIGKFIATCRKKQNLTQEQLAEKLNVTFKAVSKWETGKGLPDASIMLDLCKELKISVNELLSGEIITVDNNQKEMEKNLLEIIKQKEEADKSLLTLEWVIAILSIIVLFVPITIGALLPFKEEWIRLVIVFSGFIPAFIGFHFTMKIEQTAGYYECRHCHHKYIPTIYAMYVAPHIGRTRYMKCPKCTKKSWNKKVLTK